MTLPIFMELFITMRRLIEKLITTRHWEEVKKTFEYLRGMDIKCNSRKVLI